MVLNLEILNKFYILYHNSAKTGCIPEPAAPYGLVGSSSTFYACMLYIHMVCLHMCMEISPIGMNSLLLCSFFFKLNTANQDYIYINLENWKRNMGKGTNLKFSKGLIEKI